VLVLQSSLIFAQTPNQFKYQAVLRNADGTIMTEESVTVVISILKSDLTTSVFEETHNITTNLYGLINLNIGSEEDLSVINWTLDEYFIEISVNGTIIGTSQLLSVPYALHAKTAENITGTITENDPIYLASEAANIASDDITNLTNLSGTNTGDQDISNLATQTALADTASDIRADIPDVNGFITNETDPVYLASEAVNITSSDITNLNNLSGTNTGDQNISNFATQTALEDTASNIRNDIPDVSSYITSETDPIYSAWNKNYNDLTNTPNIIDSISTVIDTTTQFIRTEADGDETNEIQNLVLKGDTLNLSSDTASIDLSNLTIEKDWGFLTVRQVSGATISNGYQVQFMTLTGTLELSNSKVTLKANKTYELAAHLMVNIVNDICVYQWYDTTNDQPLGNNGYFSSTTDNLNNSSANYIIKPVTDIEVELRIIYAPSAIITIYTAYSYASIKEL
jgi:hypothetical protein